MRYLILLSVFLCACASSPRSTTAEQNLNSAQTQATNARIFENANQKSTREAREIIEAAHSSATEQAKAATSQAATSTSEARADAVSQLNLEQQQIAFTATVKSVIRQMTIDSKNADRIVSENQATITAANEAAAVVQQNSAIQTDFWYLLPDLLMRFAPCALLIFAMLLVSYIVRSIAARIAGDEGRARMALANPGITVYLPTALLTPPRDEADENEIVTDNMTTADNTDNSQITDPITPESFDLSYQGESRQIQNMSREEYHELVTVRHEAIALLDRCVTYYRDNQKEDDGTIPRYDAIRMNPNKRGEIVDNLWYSQYVVKSHEGTRVDPAYYTSCYALMQAIKNKYARIYPMGYHDRKQQRLESAINALPESGKPAPA